MWFESNVFPYAVFYRCTSPIRKRPPPVDPRHRPTVTPQGVAFSYEQGTPVKVYLALVRALVEPRFDLFLYHLALDIGLL